MKKMSIVLSGILAFGLPAAPASAQFIPQATAIPGSAPEGINYQGRLEDGGFPVNATKSMIFRVYTAPVGGVLLWTSPAQAVSVALGLFSAVVPVPTTVLVGGGARYLEVSIDGTLMSPRELLNSVPYALIAKSVEGNIDVSTAGLSINANSTAPQPALYISSVTGNVGVGTGAPLSAFDVGGAAAFGSASTKSTFTAAGALLSPNVSVGTGTASSVPLYVVQAVGASSMAQFYNTGSGHIIDVQGNGSISHITGIDSRYKLTPSASANFGVTNHDYGGLAIGSAGLYSGITSGGSTINGGIRELYFYTNNDFSAAKMHITSGGRVGVGNLVPAGKLHLSSGTIIVDGNTATALTTIGSVGVGTASPGTKLHLSSGTLTIDGNTATALTTVGNIGVGTSLPASRLHISTGTLIIDGSAANSLTTTGRVGVGTSLPASKLHMSTGTLVIDGNAANSIITTGNIGVGTDLPASKLHLSSGTVIIDGNTANSITTTGNVGVGTASPATKLHISSGVLTIDGTSPGIVVGLPAIGANVGQLVLMRTGGILATDTTQLTWDSAGDSLSVNGLFIDGQTIRSEASETLSIKSSNGNGVVALASDAAERVGIGTSLPASKLHLSSGTIVIDGNVGTALTTFGHAGIGTGGLTAADRLEVAGGNVRLTAVAGSAGSVKLFSTLTVGAVDCTTQCGANTFCLAAWDSAGVASTCGTAVAANRCLCSGFGN